MFEDQEIISTIEMVKNENLDVRAVTLGINLFDCISHDLNIFKKIFAKKSSAMQPRWWRPVTRWVKNTV